MKFVGVVVLGVSIVLGGKYMADNSLSYVVKNANYAEADCGCGYYNEKGFDVPIGQRFASFGKCLDK